MRTKSKARIICEIYSINSKERAVPAYRLYDLQFKYPSDQSTSPWPDTRLNPKLKKAFELNHHIEPTFAYNMFYSYLTRQATDRKNTILRRFKKNKRYYYYIVQ